MAETLDFFNNHLPKKLTGNPSLAKDINAIFQFDIDGAGVWAVDLTSGEGKVITGAAANPGCVVSAKKADFEAMLDNPSSAMMLFMQGKLKVSNIPLGMALQKLLA